MGNFPASEPEMYLATDTDGEFYWFFSIEYKGETEVQESEKGERVEVPIEEDLSRFVDKLYDGVKRLTPGHRRGQDNDGYELDAEPLVYLEFGECPILNTCSLINRESGKKDREVLVDYVAKKIDERKDRAKDILQDQNYLPVTDGFFSKIERIPLLRHVADYWVERKREHDKQWARDELSSIEMVRSARGIGDRVRKSEKEP